MSDSKAPVSGGVAWVWAHRFFHERSLGRRVVLSQLPLTLTVVLVLAIVLVFHPELLLDPVFLYGLVLHAVLFILAVAIPWHRLPAAASLAIPVLDFLPIGMVRASGVETIPALGSMAVLPVVWITSSQLYPRFCLAMSFVGPLLMVWVPLVLSGSISAEGVQRRGAAAPVDARDRLRGHTLSASRDHQQRTAEESRAQLQEALESSARKERLLNTVIDAVGVGVLALDGGGKITLRNRQQQRNQTLLHDPTSGGAPVEGRACMAAGEGSTASRDAARSAGQPGERTSPTTSSGPAETASSGYFPRPPGPSGTAAISTALW